MGLFKWLSCMFEVKSDFAFRITFSYRIKIFKTLIDWPLALSENIKYLSLTRLDSN